MEVAQSVDDTACSLNLFYLFSIQQSSSCMFTVCPVHSVIWDPSAEEDPDDMQVVSLERFCLRHWKIKEAGNSAEVISDRAHSTCRGHEMKACRIPSFFLYYGRQQTRSRSTLRASHSRLEHGIHIPTTLSQQEWGEMSRCGICVQSLKGGRS